MTLDWLRICSSKRFRDVALNGTSDLVELSKDVPQGCVLGP